MIEWASDQSKGADTLSIELHSRKESEAGASRPDGLAGSEALESLVIAALEDDKAEDIVSIDLAGKSSVTDFMIVATGRSNRHVGAIADHLIGKLKESGHGAPKVEGLNACDWVLIDAGDVIIHLFRPEVRAFYDLEKMWAAAPEGSA